MRITSWLRRIVPGRNYVTDDEGLSFRCLRCGKEFDRQYDTCTDCGNRFVARVDED